MPSFEQSTGTLLKQQQSTVLSQKQLRSLELLHLPLPALESRLAQELTENPVLEEGDISRDETDNGGAEDVSPADEPEDEALLAEKAAEADEWSDELPLPGERETPLQAGENWDLLGNSPAPGPTLREILLMEIDTTEIPEELIPAVIEIISALDNDGYLRTNLADLAMICDASADEMETALHLVQNIAPPGVAARDLAECLALQLERQGGLTEKMKLLLSSGLEDVAENRLSGLEAKLGVTRDELNAMLGVLRSLNPAPGGEFSPSAAETVQPELEIVRQEDGSYKVVALRENFRKLSVSKLYEKLAEKENLSPEDKAYLLEKIASAKELIKALAMRDSTLLRLGEVIAEKQTAFLDKGVSELKPLTMKEAGELAGVGESTVSRAAAEKYVRTPHGVFPLRFFFSGGYGSGGDGCSFRAVMEKIREMIAGEERSNPLSDDKIAEKLNAAGIDIARRTVAKYRENMNIPPARKRKSPYDGQR